MLYDLAYCGFCARAVESIETGIFFGEIEHNGCSYSFQGDSRTSVEAAFRDVIDEVMSEPDAKTLFSDSAKYWATLPTLPAPLPPELDTGVFDRGKRFDC